MLWNCTQCDYTGCYVCWRGAVGLGENDKRIFYVEKENFLSVETCFCVKYREYLSRQ